MKVSILVPIYNVECYIERCARSILEQTYDNIEVVFVNDCTKDRSVEILQSVLTEYSNRRFFIISHDYNRGLGATRITGLNHANGDFVMFVDSDDYLEFDAVEQMVTKQKEEDSDVVIASFMHIFKGSKHSVECYQHLSPKQLTKKILTREVSLNVWAKLFKRTLFTDSGINFIKNINMGEDYVTISRLVYYIKTVSYVDKPVYNYIHTNDKSYTSTYKHKNVMELLKAQKVVNTFYRNIGDKQLLRYHQIGNQKLKAELFILMLRAANHNKTDYHLINNLFIDDSDIDVSINALRIQDRMIVKACGFLPEPIMSFLVKIGFNIKQKLKF